MTLKFYYDLMSQPSRALYILLKTSKCDFESKEIRLAKGEQFSQDFAAINRFQKVPVINHSGFILTESVAIARYLFRENLVPDTLYPRDSKSKARVDEYLEWQHIGLRLHCGMFFVETFLKPFATGKPADDKAIQIQKKNMLAALEVFEKHWLNNGTEFVSGNHVTIADLFAITELEQTRLGGYNPVENFEKIGMWHAKVRQYCNPHYDDAHVYINKGAEKVKKAKAQN